MLASGPSTLAAGLATLRFFLEHPVIDRMWRTGRALVDTLNAAAAEAGVSHHFEAGGVDCSPWYVVRDRDGAVSLPLRTLFLQEMAERGVLINYIAPGWSHTPGDVERTQAAARESLAVLGRALEDGWQRYLRGAPIQPVFRVRN